MVHERSALGPNHWLNSASKGGSQKAPPLAVRRTGTRGPGDLLLRHVNFSFYVEFRRRASTGCRLYPIASLEALIEARDNVSSSLPESWIRMTAPLPRGLPCRSFRPGRGSSTTGAQADPLQSKMKKLGIQRPTDEPMESLDTGGNHGQQLGRRFKRNRRRASSPRTSSREDGTSVTSRGS